MPVIKEIVTKIKSNLLRINAGYVKNQLIQSFMFFLVVFCSRLIIEKYAVQCVDDKFDVIEGGANDNI